MTTLQTLPAAASIMVKEFIQKEQAEFYFYVSASAWCRLNGYQNAARYFEVESMGEEYHYKRLMTFLGDWNVEIEFTNIAAPAKKFKSLQDIIEMAYEMEYNMLRDYEGAAMSIFNESMATYSKMFDFVNMQNDAVITFSKLIIKLKQYAAEDPSLITFDQEVFNEYGSLAY